MQRFFPLAFAVGFSVSALAQDPVLATNEWVTVTKADFDAEVAKIPANVRYELLTSAESVNRMVESVIVNKTLAAQARAGKLDQDPAAMAEIRVASEKILARRQLERAEAEFKVPDFTKRAEELYKANPRKYAERTVVHARHILVEAKCRTPEAAKARATEARSELVAGQPFDEVARKYSDDPSAVKNGGDLGPIVVDNLSPAFAEAAQSLKPGELSQPVLTNFGYHVIRLESVKPGRVYTLEEIRPGIIAELKEDWLKRERRALVDNITADPKLKLDLDAIQALKTGISLPAPPRLPAS